MSTYFIIFPCALFYKREGNFLKNLGQNYDEVIILEDQLLKLIRDAEEYEQRGVMEIVFFFNW